MGIGAFLILLLVGSAGAAYRRTPLRTWSAFVAVALIGYTAIAEPLWPAVLAWLLLLPAATILNIPPLRRTLISRHVLAFFRSALPPMSATEREALEAGSVGWDGELFSGRPDWKRLLDLPAPALDEREQAFLDGPAEELCRMSDDWRITHELHDLPPEAWTFMKENGFFGMIIPRAYGGLGFSALAHSSVIMKLASRSISVAVTAMVPNSLGPAELLLNYGTEEQKNHYLPRLARGVEIPCFALTSPDAGSDAAAMTDTGIVCRGAFEGRNDVLGIRLNWRKRYITLGPVATVLGLAFKLYDPDHLLGGHEDIGITLALIPTGTPGIEIGRRHMPLSMAFMNGPTRGTDVFIPVEWIIGGPERAGQGWRMLMECLAAGRSISLPALSTGAGKTASRATGAYARIRRQFHLPIGRFEGVEAALARIAGNAYEMDAARVLTAAAVDAGQKPSVISAIVKYHLTERMRDVVNDAMDVHGGSGICLGPRNVLGRAYQALPISITVEGANILTRSLIIFGQGAIRCHPYVLEEMRAATDTNAARALVALDRAFFGHIGFTLGNAVRSLWLGLTGARMVAVPDHDASRRLLQLLTRVSAAFALAADIAMLTLGGTLKRSERLSARLGDVLSALYLASAAVKRFRDQGAPYDDEPLLRWACTDLLHRAQQALDELLDNFPNRAVAWILRRLIFPLGLRQRGPSDALDHQLAAMLLTPSPARDRLTAGIFVGDDPRHPVARLEGALLKIVAAEAVERKLRAARAQGELSAPDPEQELEQAVEADIISPYEASVLRGAEAARAEAIAVDDFPPDHWCKEYVECLDAQPTQRTGRST